MMDPLVDVFISRDLDSAILTREVSRILPQSFCNHLRQILFHFDILCKIRVHTIFVKAHTQELGMANVISTKCDHNPFSCTH